MQRLFFKYQNMIPNAHLILELMDLVLKGAIMKFQEEFFMQIMGIVMGTNLAPILANLYMAMLEEELYIVCIQKNIVWPEMFKRFIDDGFGVIKSNKNNFLCGLQNSTTYGKIFLYINGSLGTMLHLWTYIYSRE